ncbi:MAG: hypothetical protein PHZ25_00830 [Candidatus Pacebacteria bacterium]|nr:hypothetical protein [Candidatus Paceibacterota bacterium]
MIQKNIGFLLDRSSSIKAYAPVIIEVLRRNSKVFILCQDNKKPTYGKSSYSLVKENLKIPGIEETDIIYFDNSSNLLSLIEKNEISTIFTLPFIKNSFDNFFQKIEKRKFKLFCLQWFGDHFIMDPELIEILDGFFVYSQETINSYLKAYSLSKDNNLRFIPIGFPPRESLNFLPDKKTIRQQYGIPQNQKVVLLFSLNITNKDPFWISRVFGEPNRIKSFLKCVSSGYFKFIWESIFGTKYADIIKIIKKWCQENNAILIVKSRPKHNEPDFIKKNADIFIVDDETWFPHKSFEALTLSDLSIHFCSSSILESAVSDVFSINIFAPKFLKESYRPSFFYRSLFESPGVSEFVSYKKIDSFLKKNKLEDLQISPQEKNKYLLKNTGFLDSLASKRILDYLEKQEINYVK